MIAELRPGLRALRHRPLPAIAAIVTIALGVMANTAVFAVLHAVLLEPLPFSEPERLVVVRGVDPEAGSEARQIFPPLYLALEEDPSPAEAVAAIVADDQMVFRFRPDGSDPVEVRGAVVSARLFSMLGVPAELGRVFREEEDEPGSDDVAILGHGLWRRHFGGDPRVIGRRLDLNDNPYTVVGILPEGLELPRGVEIWVPDPERASEVRNLPIFFFSYFDVVARLRPGVDLRVAEEALDSRYHQAKELYPDAYSPERIELVPLQDDLRRGSTATLGVLQAAGAALLLLCCANVAGLLLIRLVRRRGELAMRRVLGAQPGRLLRQLVVEHGWLFLLGGGLGLAAAVLALRVLVAAAPAGWLQLADVRLSGASVAFTLGSVALAGLVFGSLPALLVLRGDRARRAREGLAAGGGTRHHLGEALVVFEIAVAVTLLLATGLLVRSLVSVHSRDLGFTSQSVAATRLTLLDSRYPERGARDRFFDRLRRSFASIPGVEAVGGTQYFFLTDGVYAARVTGVDGRSVPESERLQVRAAFVTPGYFAALGLPLLSGREIGQGAEVAEAVVSRSLARRFWGARSPLGRGFELDGRWWTVVGISGDLRSPGADADDAPEVFLPQALAGLTTGQMTFLIRGSPGAGGLASAVRARVREIDPGQTVSEVVPLADVVDRETAAQRYGAQLLSVFAGIALTLAGVGVYGVLGYTVELRRQEIGVRAALGASPGRVGRAIAGRGIRLGLAGALLGVLGGVAAARGLRALLFGVEAWDPMTWIVTLATGVAVSVLAAWLPALRARRVDPSVALREH